MGPTVGQSMQEHERVTVGVLLYYKYVKLGNQKRGTVKDWYERACRQEGLRGRCSCLLCGLAHLDCKERNNPLPFCRGHPAVDRVSGIGAAFPPSPAIASSLSIHSVWKGPL